MNNSPEAARNPVAPQEVVVDDVLTLRRIKADDAPAFYELVSQNRDFLAESFDWAPGLTPEGAASNCAWLESANESGESAAYLILEEGTPVGSIGLFDIHDGLAERNIWLAEDQTGKGIAHRATKALVQVGFEQLGIDTVTLHIRETNLANKKHIASLGAQQVGEATPGSEFYETWEIRDE